jgi:GNAT superfamily N-acetyltransferase
MPKPESISVRPFAAPDEAAVLELLESSFGSSPGGLEVSLREFFRWKHLQCAFGPSIKVVAEAGGEVIGFEGHLPWNFKVGAQTVRSSRATDLCVHSSYRRRGVSVALREAIELAPEVAFQWGNPSPQSHRGSLRFGSSDIGVVPRFVRPTGSLVKRVRRVVGSKPGAARTIDADAQTAGEALRDGSRISQLLAQVAGPRERLRTDRTLAFLRWRYGRFDEYRAVTSGARESAEGLIIFRLQRRGGIWISQVCEVLVERGERQTTRSLLRRVRACAPSDLIVCNFRSRREAAAFGFVQDRSGAPLMTHPLKSGLVPDPTRIDSWSLSRGDLELL